MATRRQRRVAEQIHRELSLLLMREVRDPRLAAITITEVKVSPDLMVAQVYFTQLGDADEAREALLALEHARGFLRTELAGRIRLRSTPELRFEMDKSAEYGSRIDELLAQIEENRPAEDGSEAVSRDS